MRDLRLNLRSVFSVFSVGLALILILGACSGSSGNDDDDSDAGFGLEEGLDRDGSGANGESFESDDAGGAVGAGEAEAVSDSAAPQTTNYVVNQIPFDRLIIRTVNISLTVEDVSQGSIWVRDLAARKNGFVFSSNTYVRDESEFAQITIRVPAEQLDSTVQELREHDLVIQVDSEETTSQDVSQEYVDNEARLEALEETQRRFLALLSEANTVEDILRIEAELTNIRSQIETIKGRQSYLDQMTSFSTVTITMHVQDDAIEPAEEDEEGFIARLFSDAWGDASGFIEGFLAGVITLGIVALAVLPLALVVYFLARFGYRRFVDTRRADRPEEPAPRTAGD